MNEADTFWKACIAVPEDELQRLAFADYLEESGFTLLSASLREWAGGQFVKQIADKDSPNLLRRLLSTPEIDRVDMLQDAVWDVVNPYIWESESASGTMAETNATDWSVDEFDLEITECKSNECTFSGTFVGSGEQIEDKWHYGNSMSGTF